MNTHTLGQILQFLLSFLCLWFFLFVLYKRLALDFFRQKLFQLRDDLFDDAANGLINFNHPSYVVLRNTMNGFLRFGHKISFFQLLITIVIHGDHIGKRKSFRKVWQESSATLTPEQKTKLEPYLVRLNELLLLQSFFGSPFFVIFLLFGYILMHLPGSIYGFVRTYVFKIMNTLMQKPLEELESTAMAYGCVR
jgi:hypothetical protein